MAAAPTSTGASQDGASSPSSRVRAACQAMSPAPAAARRRFRILPSKAAGSSGNIANRGASSTGQSGGESTPAGAPGGGGGAEPIPPPGANAGPAARAAADKNPTSRPFSATAPPAPPPHAPAT